MGSVGTVLVAILGLGFAVLNILFWHRVVTRGDDHVRHRVERRHGVTIHRGPRGHWKVTSGPGSKVRHFFIELLQLAYFMGAFVVWGIGVGLVVLVMSLVHDAL